MSSDKAFGIYALLLVSGVVSVITTSVLAGFATLPSFLVFVEHLAMGVLMRASYKSLDGPYFLPSAPSVEVAAEPIAAAIEPAQVASERLAA